MKRKVVMALVLSMALMTAGCANSGNATTESAAETTAETGTEAESGTEDSKTEAKAERPEYTALDYVTLGEYKELPVTLASTDVTEEEIDAEVTSTLSQNDKLDTLTEGTVEDGDIANIDYEGTKDGEAFDGGTDKGYDLTIGSGSFIEGFESGLIGKKVGESVDLNLTFPENYGSEELAGQDVVFHVTINSVKRAPEMTDELASELSDAKYSTVEEYRKSVADTLKEQKKSQQESQEINDLMTQVYQNATINDYPEDVVEYEKKNYVDYYQSYADQSEMTLSEFLDQNYQMTEDDFNTQIEQMVQQSLSQEMLLRAIAENESLEISDEEYKTGAQGYADQYGFESVEALEEQYGKKTITNNLLMDKALKVVEDSAVVTDPNKEDASEDGTEAESSTEKESSTETETETETESETK